MKKGKRNSTESMWDSVILPGDDIILQDMVDEFFRAEMDILEVRCDPAYANTDKEVKAMLADHKHGDNAEEVEKFIRKNLPDLNEEISTIKEEIRSRSIDAISSEWTKEWNKKKLENATSTTEIREYVTSAINEVEKQPDRSPDRDSQVSGRLIIRYVSAAAAILAGAIFMITALVPENDTEKLFERYYEPVSAVSPVTRSTNGNKPTIFLEAVNNYNKADYSSAAAGFSELVSKDPSLLPPRFYLGMSYLALGNNSQASQLLKEISDTKGEYSGEARWYLGLVYLKEGDKEKAAGCFELLSKTTGYYSKPSARILRRLK